MKCFLYSIAAFIVVLLVYLPSVRYRMVGLDDHEYVYTNMCVMTGLSAANVRWAATSCGYASNWHPLTWISLQTDASLLREKPPALTRGLPTEAFAPISSVMHAHNVALHAANAALLFLLITVMRRRLDPDQSVPFPLVALFALLWAIHPLRTEVVCWVSERKELLSVFFMLLTMIAYIGGQGRWFSYVISLVFFALALAAKPVAVTLPVVLFAWDWVLKGRQFGKTLLAMIPFLILAAGAGALTLASQGVPLDIGTQFSLWEKVVMSVSAPAIYLRQTFWPMGLSAFYPSKPPVPWVELGLGAALFAGSVVVCLAWLRWRRSAILSLLAFAVAWCLVSLVPMLGIVKVGDQPHSDRYTYWVGCGFVALAALAIVKYAKGRERETMKVLAVIVVVLAVATRMRMPVWHDAASLYADAVPKSWNQQAVCALASILRDQGKEGERQAEAMLRQAVMKTRYVAVQAEFAHLLACKAEGSSFHLGDEDSSFAEARYEAESVLSLKPDNSLANEALAIVEMKEGKWEPALKHLELARVTSKDVKRVDHYIALCRDHQAEGKKEPNVQR